MRSAAHTITIESRLPTDLRCRDERRSSTRGTTRQSAAAAREPRASRLPATRRRDFLSVRLLRRGFYRRNDSARTRNSPQLAELHSSELKAYRIAAHECNVLIGDCSESVALDTVIRLCVHRLLSISSLPSICQCIVRWLARMRYSSLTNLVG